MDRELRGRACLAAWLDSQDHEPGDLTENITDMVADILHYMMAIRNEDMNQDDVMGTCVTAMDHFHEERKELVL